MDIAGFAAIYVLDGPWGNEQTEQIHTACDIYIPESVDPGTLRVSLSLDRTTTNVQVWSFRGLLFLELIQICHFYQ